MLYSMVMKYNEGEEGGIVRVILLTLSAHWRCKPYQVTRRVPPEGTNVIHARYEFVDV